MSISMGHTNEFVDMLSSGWMEGAKKVVMYDSQLPVFYAEKKVV